MNETFVQKYTTWTRGSGGRDVVLIEQEERYYFTLMEGEVEQHEKCLGPDCDCWKEEKP